MKITEKTVVKSMLLSIKFLYHFVGGNGYQNLTLQLKFNFISNMIISPMADSAWIQQNIKFL